MISLGSLAQSQAKMFKQSSRVLMIVFVVIVITAILPVNVRSQVWGHQLSTTVLNVCVLPWLAIALGRLGVIGEQREQLLAWKADAEASRFPVKPELEAAAILEGEISVAGAQPGRPTLVKDGWLLSFARFGFYSLILLAIWQAVLFGGSLKQIDARQVGQSQAIDQRFNSLEGRLKVLPPANLEKAMQQLGLVGSAAENAQDPFDLLSAKRAQLKLEANRQVSQARFMLTRESLRNFLLALVYSAGFYGLARS